MSITLKFEDKGYLPGLAHQLVTNLQDNPAAELIGVEHNPKGVERELVFGLDGQGSTDDRLLFTDVEVLVAAREYCRQSAPEFTGKMLAHSRDAAYMIDQQTVPTFMSSRADADGHGGPGADA